MNLKLKLITVNLNGTYVKVRTGKKKSDIFALQNGLKQGDVLTVLIISLI